MCLRDVWTAGCVVAITCGVAVNTAFAAAPALRDEVNLAGSWTGGTVPRYTSGNGFTGTRTYERTVTVPSNWTGKRVFLELEAVAWGDVTSVNGTQVGSSTGGWLPHSYDITTRVTPGQNATITVVANGSKPSGSWPTGFPNYDFSGQFYDAYLRAYGTVAIRDVEIVTSVANGTITARYSVQNFGTTSKTITVNANAIPSTGGASAVSCASTSATIAAGATSTIQATTSWTNPSLWWPTDPKLYLLCSAVKESGATLDSQTVRFGFREVTVAGRYVKLNGVRINLRGTSYEMGSSRLSSATAMADYITQAKATNSNSVRFHAKPQANALLDVCDEMGYCIESEAALWQAPGECTAPNTKNVWFPAFIKNQRNHASVIAWSGANECDGMGETAALDLVNIIKANDGSKRLVWLEMGSAKFGSLPTDCVHYPEGYLNSPGIDLIYSTNWINQSKPQGNGEWCTSYDANGANNRYWHGTWARGMRYNNVTLIHGYTEDWAYTAATSVQKTNLTNSHNPVALFDKDYDGLGIAPIRDNSFPSIAAGSTANRTLVLYNDEFSNNIVTVQVDIKSGATTYATATKSYQVELGNHITIPCSFQVPYVGGSAMDLVLTTSKSGVTKFTESKRFNVTGASTGTSSSTVTLGGTGIDPTTPIMQLSPAAVVVNGTTGIDVANQTVQVTNAGAGTLGALTARIAYGTGATNWITPVTGGSGNSRSITLQFSTAAITGGTFTAQLIVKSAGALPDSTVCPITLAQVGPDNTPPTILRVAGTKNAVYVVFSEPVNATSAAASGNYSLTNGITVTGATLGSDSVTVTLTTSTMTVGTGYTLTVNNVRDLATVPNTIAANTAVQFQCADAITRIRYYPRPGWGSRMVGGVFEGTSGDKAAGPYTTIYTITAQPPEGQWTETTNLSNISGAYRYVRYRASGNCNVAEIEFYIGSVKITGTPFGTPGSYAAGMDYTKAWDGDVTTFFDYSQTDGGYTGLDISGATVVSRRMPAPVARGYKAADRILIPMDNSTVVRLHDVRGNSVRVMRGPGRSLALKSLPAGYYTVYIMRDGVAQSRFGFIR